MCKNPEGIVETESCWAEAEFRLSDFVDENGEINQEMIEACAEAVAEVAVENRRIAGFADEKKD